MAEPSLYDHDLIFLSDGSLRALSLFLSKESLLVNIKESESD